MNGLVSATHDGEYDIHPENIKPIPVEIEREKIEEAKERDRRQVELFRDVHEVCDKCQKILDDYEEKRMKQAEEDYENFRSAYIRELTPKDWAQIHEPDYTMELAPVPNEQTIRPDLINQNERKSYSKEALQESLDHYRNFIARLTNE